MSRKQASRKDTSRKDSNPKGRAASKLSAVRALVARSTIAAAPTQSDAPLSNWQEKRKSADVDALVLAWIASHVQGPLHRGQLN